MRINYWDCPYSESEYVNIGTKNRPDYQWIYGCTHPKTETDTCDLENKYCGDLDNCSLIDH